MPAYTATGILFNSADFVLEKILSSFCVCLCFKEICYREFNFLLCEVYNGSLHLIRVNPFLLKIIKKEKGFIFFVYISFKFTY